MSKYFRASQVNILDIWCDITRYFVSRVMANCFDISAGFSPWILRIFCRTFHCQLPRYSVLRLTVNIHDITSAVLRYFVSRFTANYVDISSGVRSIFCRASGKTLGYFVVRPKANYLNVLWDASRWINAVFFGRLMVNILETVLHLKGQLPRWSVRRLPVNYRDNLSGTSQ